MDLGDFDIITVDTGVSNIATLDTQAICDLLSDYVKVSIVDNASITKKVLEECSYSNVNFSTNGCELPALYLSVFYLDYIENAHTVCYYKSNMEKASQLTKELIFDILIVEYNGVMYLLDSRHTKYDKNDILSEGVGGFRSCCIDAIFKGRYADIFNIQSYLNTKLVGGNKKLKDLFSESVINNAPEEYKYDLVTLRDYDCRAYRVMVNDKVKCVRIYSDGYITSLETEVAKDIFGEGIVDEMKILEESEDEFKNGSFQHITWSDYLHRNNITLSFIETILSKYKYRQMETVSMFADYVLNDKAIIGDLGMTDSELKNAYQLLKSFNGEH